MYLLRPTNVMDHDNYVTSPSGQPASLVEDTDLLGRKIVETVSGVTYTGRAAEGASTSDAVWQITRELISGTTTSTEHADNGNFSQIWDNRVSLFSTIPYADTKSVVFDGINDSLSIPSGLNYNKANTWSWSYWVRFRSTAAQTVFARRSASSLAGIAFNMLSGGAMIFDIANTNTLKISGRSAVLVPNTWYNMVITYDGSGVAAGMKVYINGAQITLGTVLDALGANDITTAAAAQLGAYGVTQYLNGHLDEVSHWSNVLTLTEVIDIYNDGAPKDLTLHANYANLLYWWRMGDNVADIYPAVKDNKGTNHLTMVNMSAANFTGVVP